MKSTVKPTAYTVLLELFGPSHTSTLDCDLPVCRPIWLNE